MRWMSELDAKNYFLKFHEYHDISKFKAGRKRLLYTHLLKHKSLFSHTSTCRDKKNEFGNMCEDALKRSACQEWMLRKWRDVY